MIEVEHLYKTLGNNHVLEDVNFKVEDGKIFGLVGINGAGKSTLLRLMSGVYKEDAGKILYDGKEVYENVEVKKDIFFLSDYPYYPKNSTVATFLDFYSTFYDVDINLFNKLLKEFKLPLQKSINNYSKGMKRQLFIALAIAISPKYLLLDEAFDGLDPLARLIFKRNLIKRLEAKNMTVVISSHSLRELEDICDSYGLLDNHKIMHSGDLLEDKENIHTYQVAFEKDLAKEDFKDFNVCYFSKLGKVIKIVIKGNKDEVVSKLNKMHPIFLDVIPLNFEEMFVYEVEEKGYIDHENK